MKELNRAEPCDGNGVPIPLCDCGHPLSDHQPRNTSFGSNPLISLWCRLCSCIDFEAVV